MPRDPHFSVRMAAFAAAMSAKAGELDLADARRLKEQAQDVLPEDSRLRQAVEDFELDSRVHARDPNALAQIGDALHSYIAVLNTPDVPGQSRKDIHG